MSNPVVPSKKMRRMQWWALVAPTHVYHVTTDARRYSLWPGGGVFRERSVARKARTAQRCGELVAKLRACRTCIRSNQSKASAGFAFAMPTPLARGWNPQAWVGASPCTHAVPPPLLTDQFVGLWPTTQHCTLSWGRSWALTLRVGIGALFGVASALAGTSCKS